MASLDLKLPNFGDTDFNSKEAVLQLRDYLFRLKEQLDFVLANLETDNLSSSLAQKIESAGGESSGIEAIAELDEMRSSIEQNASKIALVVEGENINAAQIVAAINDGASSIQLKADHIDLNGYVTANEGFAIFDGETQYGHDLPAKGSVKCTEGYIGTIRITPTGTIVPNDQTFAIGDMIFMNDSVTNMREAKNLQLYWSQLCLDTHGRWDVVTANGTHVMADLGDGNGNQYLYAKPSNENYRT